MSEKMRTYHRYLGYFLTGIMTMYAISGIIMIFRDTDFLKQEKVMEREVKPNLTADELGREIRVRDLKFESEEGDMATFRQGTYNKSTGAVTIKVKELPYVLEKMTKLHKANTKQPLFFLNIFFGLSLLFFVISAFYMYLPATSIFKKGLYFAGAGILFALILIFI